MTWIFVLGALGIAILTVLFPRPKKLSWENLSDTRIPPNPIREILFGDVPLSGWQGDRVTPPWDLFAAAEKHLEVSQIDLAISALQSVLSTHGLESRHYLQAWTALRSLGVYPADHEALNVLGVVMELGMPKGHDYLAAYSDHSARYFNFSGAGVVWEHPNASLDPLIDKLLQSAERTVMKLGPWDKPRPGPPPNGQMRLNFLTPSGLYFGQAYERVFHSDPLAKEILANAHELMCRLMNLGKNADK